MNYRDCNHTWDKPKKEWPSLEHCKSCASWRWQGLLTLADGEFLDPQIEQKHAKGCWARYTGNYIGTCTCDGYHTFDELYEYRKVYNALAFNEYAKQGIYNVHKSKKHYEGDDCFGGGWFVVMAQLPTGQVSNHYELKDWNYFKCEEREKADKWDGHTPEIAKIRMQNHIIGLITTKN